MTRQIQTPAARAGDPHTSHAAVDAMTRSGERDRQRAIVTMMVRSWPGSTSAELADYAGRYSALLAARAFGGVPTIRQIQRCELDRWQIARRLPEAETAEEVERGEARQCAVKGRKSLTWWPRAKGARQ